MSYVIALALLAVAGVFTLGALGITRRKITARNRCRRGQG